MLRTFRLYDPNAPLPMPVDLREWLPENHLVHLLGEIIDALDLSPIHSAYEQGDGRGYPPYQPVMMVKLLLYAYSRGVVSSREIERKTYEDIAFRVLTTDQHPDHNSISDFRERHLQALRDLFVQVVKMADRLDLLDLKHVAQDGSKVLANASKHKAMSYERMQKTEDRLSGEIEQLLEKARAADATADAAEGQGSEGPAEDVAGEIEFRQRRVARIREAKAALEQEAKERAEQIHAADAAERERREREGLPKKPGRAPNPSETPDPKAQRNFTDPQSRIMKNSDKAYVQAYNGQAAVDGKGQIIVGCDLTNQAADAPHLDAMLDEVEANTGRLPEQWSSDAGYFSADNVGLLEGRGVDAYIPPQRQKHGSGGSAGSAATEVTAAAASEPVDAATAGIASPEVMAADQGEGETPEADAKTKMRAKLATPEGKAIYGRRKAIVEPVFGQMKGCRGLRGFLLRGLTKAKGEWTLWCLTHNLLKIARAVAANPTLRQQLAAA